MSPGPIDSEFPNIASPPLVGRHGEREALLQALGDAAETGKPRVVILYGAVGTGTSRLAHWIGEEGARNGGGPFFEATHSPMGGPTDGVPRMLAEHLGCLGLSRRLIMERLEEMSQEGMPLYGLSHYECDLLAEMLTPSADPEYGEDQMPTRFVNARETHVVTAHLLERRTVSSPTIMVLDNIQWGADSLRLVEYLLNRRSDQDLPLLIVMTAKIATLGDGTSTLAGLKELEGRPDVDVHTVGPLSDDEHAILVEEILGLEPRLAKEVMRRTAGSPLFAVELVRAWMEKGLLRVTPDGIALRTEAQPALPDDIHHLLTRRVEEVVMTFDPERREDARQALEIAAALGRNFESREWSMACRQGGVIAPDGLFERLVQGQLVRNEANGWSFVHDALRETLERRCREGGRWQEQNRACAQMLLELFGSEKSEISARIAHHLLQGGELELAMGPLLDAAEYCGENCRFEEAHQFFRRYDQTLDKFGVPIVDRRRVQGWLVQAAVNSRQEKLDDNRPLLAQAEAVLEQEKWECLSAELHYQKAVVAHLSGNPRDTIKMCWEALVDFEQCGDFRGLARACYLLGEAYIWTGERERAAPLQRRARHLFAQAGDTRGVAKCTLSVGLLLTRDGQFERGIAMMKEAAEAFEKIGDSYAQGVAYSNLGEAYRELGRLEHARRIYEEALAVHRRAGSMDFSLSLNLCCTLMALGEFEETERILLDELLPTVVDSERRGFIGLVYATLLPCHAAARDWERWDESMDRAVKNLRGSEIFDADLAQTFELAAEFANQAGEAARFERACELALHQWKELGNEERVAKIRGVLAPRNSN